MMVKGNLSTTLRSKIIPSSCLRGLQRKGFLDLFADVNKKGN